MTRPALLLLAACVAGCSSLGDPGVPVAIEVLTPAAAIVELGDTLTLHARVLDQAGDSIAATIRWRTPDTTVAVDSVTGRFTGVFTGLGRVQAVSGSLVGPLTTFTVRPRVDTLIVTTDSLLVLTSDTASAPLDPKLADSLGTGMSGRKMVITLVAPSPAGARLSGGVTSDTATTGSDGLPSPAVRVRKVGVASGDSVIVQVSASRASGTPVPGSGRTIRVFFQ